MGEVRACCGWKEARRIRWKGGLKAGAYGWLAGPCTAHQPSPASPHQPHPPSPLALHAGLSAEAAQQTPFIASMGIYVFKKSLMLDLLDAVRVGAGAARSRQGPSGWFSAC